MTRFAFGVKSNCEGRRPRSLRQHHVVHQRRQREAADAERGLLEEVAAGDRDGGTVVSMGCYVSRADGSYSLVMVSSRFSSTLATIVHAASSASATSPPPARIAPTLLVVERHQALDFGGTGRTRQHQLHATRRGPRGRRRAAGRASGGRARARLRTTPDRSAASAPAAACWCGRAARCRTRGWSRRRS